MNSTASNNKHGAKRLVISLVAIMIALTFLAAVPLSVSAGVPADVFNDTFDDGSASDWTSESIVGTDWAPATDQTYGSSAYSMKFVAAATSGTHQKDLQVHSNGFYYVYFAFRTSNTLSSGSVYIALTDAAHTNVGGMLQLSASSVYYWNGASYTAGPAITDNAWHTVYMWMYADNSKYAFCMDGGTNYTDKTPKGAANGKAYHVSVTWGNPDGDIWLDSIKVHDSDALISPAADFTVSDRTATTDDTLTFTDTSELYGLPPSSYLWSFGDGSTNSTQASPTHKYDHAGTYTVYMRVTTTGGMDEETKTAYITIYGPTGGTYDMDLPGNLSWIVWVILLFGVAMALAYVRGDGFSVTIFTMIISNGVAAFTWVGIFPLWAYGLCAAFIVISIYAKVKE